MKQYNMAITHLNLDMTNCRIILNQIDIILVLI